MADNSTSGNKDKKVGRVSSFTRIMGSPLRSPSSKPKTPKRSSSSSSPWARLNLAKVFGGKRRSQSEREIEANIEIEEDSNFQKKTNEVVQSLAEKTKEEPPSTTKPKDEAIKTVEHKDSSSETVEKKDAMPSKVEPKVEKPKEDVKAKGNETMEKTEARLEKNVVSREAVFEPEDKNRVGGPEGINPTDQSSPGDQEEGKKEDNCISSLAQGLQTLCVPQTAK